MRSVESGEALYAADMVMSQQVPCPSGWLDSDAVVQVFLSPLGLDFYVQGTRVSFSLCIFSSQVPRYRCFFFKKDSWVQYEDVAESFIHIHIYTHTDISNNAYLNATIERHQTRMARTHLLLFTTFITATSAAGTAASSSLSTRPTMSSPSKTTSAAPRTITVEVGNGDHKFKPDVILANVGDVRFFFFSLLPTLEFYF